uniref:Uncharacterized protein n=1 Tax=Timema poppense TaxID=170557 RepID=A0A7R9DDM9_TIMPO|nr:unnamed protein product [Timema poppensis]
MVVEEATYLDHSPNLPMEEVVLFVVVEEEDIPKEEDINKEEGDLSASHLAKVRAKVSEGTAVSWELSVSTKEAMGLL